MANWYVSSVKYAAIPQWAASTAYVLGDYVRRLSGETNANGRVWKCTTAGTSDVTEPSWNLNNNSTTNSGTAVFTQVAGQEAEQTTGNWVAPFPTLASANAIVTAAADTIYVADDHVEAVAAALTVSGSLPPRICVAAGSTVPPVEADLSTGAEVGTTGNNTLTLDNACYMKGFVFRSGVGGSSTAAININNDGTYEDCEFRVETTHASTASCIVLGSGSTTRGSVEWINCSVWFNNTTQGVRGAFSELLWRDSPAPLEAGSAQPTTLFAQNSTNGARTTFTGRNLDLSGFAAAMNVVSFGGEGDFILQNCKLPASFTYPNNPPTFRRNAGVRIHNCHTDTGPINYNLIESSTRGSTTAVIDLRRTGGASDGVTGYSLKMDLQSNGELEGQSHSSPRLAKRVNTPGSQTFTIHGLVIETGSFTIPARNRLYAEFEIMDVAGTTRASLHSSRSSILDTTSVEADTSSDWTAGLSSRTNSTFYGVGSLFKVASASGKVFRAQGAGTTAASEPGDYSTCSDGDTFSDGSVVIRVCRRVKFSVTATPVVKGVVFATVKPLFPSPNTLYVDPKMEVS